MSPATALPAAGSGCGHKLTTANTDKHAGCSMSPNEFVQLFVGLCSMFRVKCVQNGKGVVKVKFSPKDSRTYEAKVALYLDDNTAQPYYTVVVQGEGLYPRLKFDTKECIMPPVPLGFPSKAQFHVISHGYDNLQLKVCMPCFCIAGQHYCKSIIHSLCYQFPALGVL